ncbi:mannose-1-phosphate guanylyltransferase [Aureivirga sp. CE67]|uniref:mannose-1-phosphate guanylyltransferase n=1 Tax=Aureivirga sp. CE67 TaxID=1788983 RepID=UPI0018C94579|nr:mannose-1-phosphate guanylyltransferase [Aureivirga sp. CE67]
MQSNYYAIIMAGGIGSRFWPVSTKKFPKQFHDMLGTGETLIQKTFSRLEKLIPAENILISTNEEYKDLVLEQLPKIDETQLILEPTMRNTAPCILYAAKKVYAKNQDAVMLVAPSDHWIEDEDTFIKSIETSFKATEKSDILMTLGIQPSYPNTGYGYIQFNEEEAEIKKVKQFTEKPNLEKAKEFLASGEYLWNAGIFIWSAAHILNSFEKFLPEMSALFAKGNEAYNTENETTFIEENYPLAENISIDFGIMEKAQNVYVLPVDFGWNDLGTWGSIYNKLPKDSQENAVVGDKTVCIDSKKNIIRSSGEKRIVVCGLEDFIVVEDKDTILICPKDKEQEIKNISAEVNEKFPLN